MDSDLLTGAEVAQLLRVSRRTVSRYAADGTLDAITLSPRVIRFRRADVTALLTGDAA